MNNKITVGIALAVVLASSSAFALNEKTDSPYDYRIKSVVYNPMDVVELDGVQGLATTIQLAPDEVYVTHNFGGKDLWELTFKDNNISVRPISALSDTNLTLITSKRTYFFVLHYIGGTPVKQPDGTVTEEFIKTPWKVKQATLGLIFKYPFEDMAAANKKLEERRVRDALARPHTGPKNLNYRMSIKPLADGIQPINVWDDYRSTSFKFAPNAELPTVTVIGSDGKETIVNTHPAGEYSNIIVADGTARQWRLRYGDKVIGIVNDGYNPSLGASSTGTVAPDVKRIKLPQGGDE
jgi:type IV secretion system protein VirB9